MFCIANFSYASTGHDNEPDDQASTQVNWSVEATDTKTIHVSLLNTMRFAFKDNLNIKVGDTVRFIVTNKDQIEHEFSIGSVKEQQAHREIIHKIPNVKHTEVNAVTVPARQTRELIWYFVSDATVVFSCNKQGHYEAGMFKLTYIKPKSKMVPLSIEEMNVQHDHASHKH